MKDIVVLNREDVDSFWKLRFDLLNELGEICSDINLIELEQSTKGFFLSSINKNLICYGVVENNEIISTVSLCLFDRIPYPENLKGKEGYILNVYTCPGFRRQGLAKLLLQEIIIYANNHNINKLWLNSSKYGKCLYSSLGFICKNDEMVLMLKN